MRTQFSKLALAAAFGLALAFTFSACSSEDPQPPSGEGPSSPSTGEQQVFCKLNAGNCSQMSLSTCMELVNAGMAQIVSNCTADPEPQHSSSSITPQPSQSSSSSQPNPVTPSSSSVIVTIGYCDYGPPTEYGEGGCYPMGTVADQSNCALYGQVVSSCPSCGTSTYSPSGQFCDTRDNKIYKYKKISTQTWMAENLNFAQTNSKCYDDLPANCTKYGRLYDWAMAMQNATSSTANPSGRKGVCPTGWHLPSDAEWDVLMTAVGGSSKAGKKLKSKTNWNGTDEYDFAALPGGRFGFGALSGTMYTYGFVGINSSGIWWSTSQNGTENAYSRSINDDDEVFKGDNEKIEMYSVRCVKD